MKNNARSQNNVAESTLAGLIRAIEVIRSTSTPEKKPVRQRRPRSADDSRSSSLTPEERDGIWMQYIDVLHSYLSPIEKEDVLRRLKYLWPEAARMMQRR